MNARMLSWPSYSALVEYRPSSRTKKTAEGGVSAFGLRMLGATSRSPVTETFESAMTAASRIGGGRVPFYVPNAGSDGASFLPANYLRSASEEGNHSVFQENEWEMRLRAAREAYAVRTARKERERRRSDSFGLVL